MKYIAFDHIKVHFIAKLQYSPFKYRAEHVTPYRNKHTHVLKGLSLTMLGNIVFNMFKWFLLVTLTGSAVAIYGHVKIIKNRHLTKVPFGKVAVRFGKKDILFFSL